MGAVATVVGALIALTGLGLFAVLDRGAGRTQDPPTIARSPRLPFTIEAQPISGPRYPKGWVRVVSSDGRFAMVGPGEPSLHAERGYAVLTFASSNLSCTVHVFDLGGPPSHPGAFTRSRIGQWGRREGAKGEARPVRIGSTVGWRVHVYGVSGYGTLEVMTGGGEEFTLIATRLWPLDKEERRLVDLFLRSLRVPPEGGLVGGAA